MLELCHTKRWELDPRCHRCRGRAVLSGDRIRCAEGHYAVISEQGASSSHLAAANTLDAISRLPGCAGEDSDATGAHHQVSRADLKDYQVRPVET